MLTNSKNPIVAGTGDLRYAIRPSLFFKSSPFGKQRRSLRIYSSSGNWNSLVPLLPLMRNATLKSLISIGYFEPKDNEVNYNELYDLQNDPHELNNLYGKPGYEKITKQLQKELDAYRKAQNVDEF